MKEYEDEKITLYRKHYEAMENLSSKDRGEIYLALFNYIFKGIEPHYKSYKQSLWQLIKSDYEGSYGEIQGNTN